MHSNIYQLIDDEKEVMDDIPEWWVDEGNCDYYHEMDDKDRASAIEWLANTEKVDGENVTIGTERLECAWRRFQEARENLSKLGRREFFEPYSGEPFIFNVRFSFSDELGYWFLWHDTMFTHEDLEREFAGQTFRIGKVWDYHR